jgi:hypothetical protein
MGASAWHYTVVWEEDIASALESLRRDVFARGDYFQEEDRDPDNVAVGALSAAASPDSALFAQPESGTHSIIDIYAGVSAEPEPFTASPLTPEQIVQFFGTLTPLTGQVEHWLTEVDPASIRQRWECAFLVSHTAAGIPECIHFLGYSGD